VPAPRATFDLATGAALTLPAYLPVEVFPVTIEDGMVRVDVG
jgi:Ferredoxin subunits of nitrite reductase and ring-hydroxylating dioxygenases